MSILSGRTALVTGASQGIGHAIADGLHNAGARVILVGRSLSRLEESAAAISEKTKEMVCMEADLARISSVSELAHRVIATEPDLSILVNCGGAYKRGAWVDAPVEDLETLLRTNILGPYALTRALLPSLTRAKGDIVFVNSSVIQHPAKNAGQFAATQHALKGLADALRAEVNDQGVRVTSVFPGRTATPRQAQIFKAEGRDYTPERLLQPAQVAQSVIAGLSLVDSAELTDIYIRQRHKS
jgi:short-subunit dehydrogenase